MVSLAKLLAVPTDTGVLFNPADRHEIIGVRLLLPWRTQKVIHSQPRRIGAFASFPYLPVPPMQEAISKVSLHPNSAPSAENRLVACN